MAGRRAPSLAARWFALLALALGLAAAARAEEERQPIQVAPGVYMLRGAPGEPSPANGGRVGNTGFIVGPRGVVVIDTGSSWREGRALLAAIARTTDRPVRLAVLTQARQEFVFGATAFRERGIPIAMERRAAALMAARCDGCLREPDAPFDDTRALDALIGRPVRLIAFGHSSGPGDTAVLDVRSGTLFAGGLLDAQRIPDVQDADLAGWQRALAALHELRLTTVVPGHGPAMPASHLYTVERYLVQLQRRVQELLRGNAALSQVAQAASLPEFAGWDGYDTIHRRNASILFLRREREQFER